MSKNHEKGCNDCCPGPMGPQGPQGQQGPQGVPGPQGQPGQNGPVGPMGPEGAVGPQGLNGIDGLPGAQGPQGLQGPKGADGAVGPQGVQGQPGQQGAQGPVGPMGIAGPQGIQGVPGNCVECPCECDDLEFAECFSQTPQELATSPGPNLAGGIVKLENTVFATAGIDVSQAASAGQFKIMKAGWYDVAAGMTGTLNPIPAPLPVWTLSLFLNGVIVPGSTFSNVPISPAQASNEITADTFVHCNIGDILVLANTSTAPVFLTAPSLGTNAQTNSAYMKIVLLKAD